MRSYEDATESKTSFTRDSFASSGTVLNPKEAVRGLAEDEDGDEEELWELRHRMQFEGAALGNDKRRARERGASISAGTSERPKLSEIMYSRDRVAPNFRSP